MAFLRKDFKTLWEPEKRKKEEKELLNSMEFWRFKNEFLEIFEEFDLPQKSAILENLKKRLYYEQKVWKWCMNMQDIRTSLVELLECAILNSGKPSVKLLKSVVYDKYQNLNLAWLEAMIENYQEYGTMLV